MPERATRSPFAGDVWSAAELLATYCMDRQPTSGTCTRRIGHLGNHDAGYEWESEGGEIQGEYGYPVSEDHPLWFADGSYLLPERWVVPVVPTRLLHPDRRTIKAERLP